jgi:hypothetical protein
MEELIVFPHDAFPWIMDKEMIDLFFLNPKSCNLKDYVVIDKKTSSKIRELNREHHRLIARLIIENMDKAVPLERKNLEKAVEENYRGI